MANPIFHPDFKAVPFWWEATGQYGLISGSGGAGKHRGGMGMRKEFEVLEDGVTFCSNGDRCESAPWGAAGGGDGSRSGFRIERGNEVIELSALNTMPVRKGDVIVVETSGGGGWGVA